MVARETPASELIYWYMSQLGIPFECDKWNLNRLLTLIRLAAAKQNNQKPDGPGPPQLSVRP